jgi:hypothetical protein
MVTLNKIGTKQVPSVLICALLLLLTFTQAFAATGKGLTEDDPRVVVNFAEFKAAMEDAAILYVEVGGGINEYIEEAGSGLDAGINLKSEKVLILNGDATFTASMGSSAFKSIDCLILTTATSYLTVKGSGNLTFKASLSNGTNAVIRMDGGAVIIDSKDVTLTGGVAAAVYGSAIVQNYGSLTINSGTFIGSTAVSTSQTHFAVSLRGNQTDIDDIHINGGTFSVSRVQGDSKTSALSIHDDLTANLKITGGTFIAGPESGDYSITVNYGVDLSSKKKISDFISALCTLVKQSDSTTLVSATTAGVLESVIILDESVIETVALTIPVPVIGETGKEATTTTAHTTLYYKGWKNMSPEDLFAAGIYRYEVIIYPEEGYKFSLDPVPTVTLNGDTMTIYNHGYDYITCLFDFEVVDTTNLTTVALTIPIPVAGDSLATALANATTTTAHTSLYLPKWKGSESETLFEAGETYTFRVIVVPAEGSSFSTDPIPTVTLNGKAMKIEYNDFKHVTCSYEFTVDAVTAVAQNKLVAAQELVRISRNRLVVSDQIKSGEINIYSFNGRLIKNIVLTPTTNSISLNNLMPGFYMSRLVSNGTVKVFPFIIK